MARLVVVSNRVSRPESRHPRRRPRGRRACAALKRHPGVWFGWSGRVVDATASRPARSKATRISYVVTDLPKEDYDGISTTASPIACCGRSCITGSILPNSRAATSPAISASTSISPTNCTKILQPDDVDLGSRLSFPACSPRRCASAGTSNRIGFFLHMPFPPPEIITGAAASRAHRLGALPLRPGRLPDRKRRREFRPLSRNRMPLRGQTARTATIPASGVVRIGVFPVGVETDSFNAHGAPRHRDRPSSTRRAVAACPAAP